MASGFEVNGVDLDQYFNLIQSWETPVSTNTHAELNGVDIRQRYSPLADGSAANATGIEVNGADLNTLFAKIGTVSALTTSISPSSESNLQNGQSVTFTTTATRGVTPYKYTWSLSSSPAGAAAFTYQSGDMATVKFTSIAGSTANVTVSCDVTDSSSPSKSSLAQAACTVLAGLSASISPSSVNVTDTQQVTFTVTTAGGVTPYSYDWSVITTTAGTAQILSTSGNTALVEFHYVSSSEPNAGSIDCKVTDSSASPQSVTVHASYNVT